MSGTEVERIRASEFQGTNRTEAAVVTMSVDLYMRDRKHLVDV